MHEIYHSPLEMSSILSIKANKKDLPEQKVFLEAPPRFELGVKDLQSSALPLGHGATRTAKLSYHTVSENASVFLDKAKPREKNFFI